MPYTNTPADSDPALSVLGSYPLMKYLTGGTTGGVLQAMQNDQASQPPTLPPESAVVPKYPPADPKVNPNALSDWQTLLQQGPRVTGMQDVTDAYRARTQPETIPPPAPSGSGSILADRLRQAKAMGLGQPNMAWNGDTLASRQWDQQALNDFLTGRQPDKTQTLMIENQTPLDPRSIAMSLAGGGLAPAPEQRAAAYNIYARLNPVFTQMADVESQIAERPARLNLEQQRTDIERMKAQAQADRIRYEMGHNKTIDEVEKALALQNASPDSIRRMTAALRANHPELAGGIGVQSGGIGVAPDLSKTPIARTFDLPTDILSSVNSDANKSAGQALDVLYAKYGPQELAKVAPALRAAIEARFTGNALRDYAVGNAATRFLLGGKMPLGESFDRAVGYPSRAAEIKAWLRKTYPDLIPR